MEKRLDKKSINFNIYNVTLYMFLILGLSTFNVNAQSVRFLGSSDSGDKLVSYDVDSGTTTVIGNFGVTNIESMKYNLDYSILYAIDNDQLGTIDVNTGAFSALPNPLGVGLQGSDGVKNITDADAMAFDIVSGDLTVAVRSGNGPSGKDLLIKVNPITGKFIPGVFNGNDYIVIDTPDFVHDIDGMTYTYGNNFSYSVLIAIANNGGGNDRLIVISETGNVTDNGAFVDQNGNAIEDLEAMSSVKYNRLNGDVYVTCGSTSKIYKLNSNSDSVLTEIGTYGSGSDYEGSIAIELANANDDIYEVDSNSSTNPLNILVNDIIGGNGQGTITITTSPSHGVVTIENNGTPNDSTDDFVSYTPTLNYIGQDVFEYEICSVLNDCSTAMVNITILSDTDNDGIPNELDLDDDNDGILDTEEGCINLVVNGSFEIDNFTDVIAYPNGFTDADGTFIGQDYNNNILTSWNHTVNLDGWNQGGGKWAPAYNGTQFLDIIGNTVVNGSGSAVTVPNNELTQTINTIPGNKYKFSFYWGEDVGHVAGELVTLKTAIIDNNNVRIIDRTLNKIATGPVLGLKGPNEWYYFETVFTASTNQTTIWFSAVPPGNGNTSAGASLDFVNLVSCQDTDGDGIPDSLDLDSDNDGITDVKESGGTDVNNDGIADGVVGNTTTTMGVPSSSGTGTLPLNSDGTGNDNYLDIDSDDDGIPDNVEAQTTSGWLAPSGIALVMTDVNNNGLDDVYENEGTLGIIPNNFDGTDLPDYLDTDSDNDGVLDAAENGDLQNTVSGIDSDNDGLDDAWDDINDSAIDGFTVNDNHNPPNAINLGDADNDLVNGGDVDYRDIPTIPDFGPTIFSGNTTVIGASSIINFRVLIGEYANGVSNNISAVELRILKNSALAISFDPNLTTMNGQPVQNNNWQYDGSHPSLHKFIYIGNGGIFNANSASFIGVSAVYSSTISTSGSFPLKTTVKYFSGGETNTNNNDDIDYIEYNNN